MTTDSSSLYAALLGLKAPWAIEDDEMKPEAGEVHIRVALPNGERWMCPECNAEAPTHDHQDRTWRHLDTCQFKTLVHARVPRLACPTHGIKQLQVPWAEPGSQFTAMFEAVAIEWLQQASVTAVAKQLRISWDEASGIMERAVRRGLERPEAEVIKHVGVDETSFAKRQAYVTMVADLERSRVLYVADDRSQAALDGYWAGLSHEHLLQIEAIAMDMCAPHIQSMMLNVPFADEKLVFDKFHIAQNLNHGVDQVRRSEHRRLSAEGDTVLKGTKFDWPRHPASFTRAAGQAFDPLRERVHRMARAWELKEAAMAIFDLKAPWAARRNFERRYAWAIRSQLEPIKRVARTLHPYWDQIENYFRHRITNAGLEAINTKIQGGRARPLPGRRRDQAVNAPTRFPEEPNEIR